MLVLSRKVGERIVIGDTVVVQVLAVRRGQIRIGITAPASVSIRREELPRRERKTQEWANASPGTTQPLSPRTERHAAAAGPVAVGT